VTQAGGSDAEAGNADGVLESEVSAETSDYSTLKPHKCRPFSTVKGSAPTPTPPKRNSCATGRPFPTEIGASGGRCSRLPSRRQNACAPMRSRFGVINTNSSIRSGSSAPTGRRGCPAPPDIPPEAGTGAKDRARASNGGSSLTRSTGSTCRRQRSGTCRTARSPQPPPPILRRTRDTGGCCPRPGRSK
jgi:hypothetical protein